MHLLKSTRPTPKSISATPFRLRVSDRRSRLRPLVVRATNDGRSGVHDPAGPNGAWGTGDPHSRKERSAQEQEFMMQEQRVASEALRSEQRAGHAAGHVNVDKVTAVAREMEEISEEQADEEYRHMGRVQKWIMEAKNALYSWLKTGVEPL